MRRLPGPRGRVFALDEDLDGWKKNQQQECAAPETPSPAVPVKPRQYWRWIAATALLAVSVAAPSVYIKAQSKDPVTFSVRGNSFLAISASGEVLWQKTFPALLHPLTAPATPPFTAVVAVDLDGDGHTEVLFNPVFENPGPLELICWNADGTERFRYAVRKRVRSSEETFEPVYWIERFVPLAISGTGKQHLLVLSNHHLYYPSQVALLSADGVLEGEYWHPGRDGRHGGRAGSPPDEWHTKSFEVPPKSVAGHAPDPGGRAHPFSALHLESGTLAFQQSQTDSRAAGWPADRGRRGPAVWRPALHRLPFRHETPVPVDQPERRLSDVARKTIPKPPGHRGSLVDREIQTRPRRGDQAWELFRFAANFFRNFANFGLTTNMQ